MNLTTNYGLGKPLPGENYDVGVPNNNMDTIDAALDSIDDRLTPLAYTAWKNVAGEVSVRQDGSGSVAVGTSITLARAMKLGKLVIFNGQAAVGTTAVNDATIMLPPSLGVPKDRILNCGTLLVTKGPTGAPADQTGIARMTGDKLRIVVIALTGGFRPAPADSDISWSVMYEVI